MKNLEERFYKFLFKFYTISGALCLKFDGKRFEISKFHYYRALFIVILFPIYIFVYFFFSTEGILDGAPQMNLTKFSNLFAHSSIFIPLILVVFLLFTQTQNNGHIAKIFGLFLLCKKHFEISESKLRLFYFKILKYFLVYGVSIAIYTSIGFLGTKSMFDVKGIPKLILGFIIDLSYTSIFAFVNCLLLHFDFLFKICEESSRKIAKTHNSRESKNQDKQEQILFRITEIFNKSVSKVLTICIIFLVVAIGVMVCKNF